MRKLAQLIALPCLSLLGLSVAPTLFPLPAPSLICLAETKNHQLQTVEDKFKHSRYLGVASCSSSNCHGTSKVTRSSQILHNEFLTWFKEDNHAKAYKTLLTDEAKKIAVNLGLKAPHQEQACLSCHATLTPKERQGERFNIEDGVGCESCHGAAEGWIGSHAEKGVSHEDNVKAGLTDLVSPINRAMMCTSCHYGDDSRPLNHRLYGAGHPRVGFELDTYESVMPRHWLVDEEYAQRKASYSPTKAWLAGQYALTERFLNKLAKDPQHPDFSLYSCYSCHHDFARKEFLYKNYGGKPGEPPLDLSHQKVLAIALTMDPGDVGTNLKGIKSKIDSFDNRSDNLKRTQLALAQSLTDFSNYNFQYAEQVVMGLSAISSELTPKSTIQEAIIKELYLAVKDAQKADPRKISALIGRFISTIKI